MIYVVYIDLDESSILLAFQLFGLSDCPLVLWCNGQSLIIIYLKTFISWAQCHCKNGMYYKTHMSPIALCLIMNSLFDKIIFYNLASWAQTDYNFCTFIAFVLVMVFLKHCTLHIPKNQAAFNLFNKVRLIESTIHVMIWQWTLRLGC